MTFGETPYFGTPKHRFIDDSLHLWMIFHYPLVIFDVREPERSTILIGKSFINGPFSVRYVSLLEGTELGLENVPQFVS